MDKYTFGRCKEGQELVDTLEKVEDQRVKTLITGAVTTFITALVDFKKLGPMRFWAVNALSEQQVDKIRSSTLASMDWKLATKAIDVIYWHRNNFLNKK